MVLTTTQDLIRFPLPLRLANDVGNALRAAGVTLIPLSPKAMKTAAERITGLHDWGDFAADRGLEMLLRALNSEARLSTVGRIGIQLELRRMLINRLRLEHVAMTQPEIFRQPVRRPIFILGFPRTGTTLLHKLLAQDSANRAPHFWEVLHPTPLAQRDGQRRRRIRRTSRMVRQANRFAPQFRQIHSLNAEEPEECIFLFQNTLYFSARAHIPSYVAWYMHHDMAADYAEYRRYLQLLQTQAPERRWVLKSPFHLWSLRELLGAMPDACIIQTHRAPEEAIPSWCHLVATTRSFHSNSVDLREAAADWVPIWAEAMRRAQAARQNAPASQFLDLDYHELVGDPIGAVRRIYQQFGTELTPDAESQMRAWLKANPSNKHGKHTYSLEQFGLDAETIQRQFASNL